MDPKRKHGDSPGGYQTLTSFLFELMSDHVNDPSVSVYLKLGTVNEFLYDDCALLDP